MSADVESFPEGRVRMVHRPGDSATGPTRAVAVLEFEISPDAESGAWLNAVQEACDRLRAVEGVTRGVAIHAAIGASAERILKVAANSERPMDRTTQSTK